MKKLLVIAVLAVVATVSALANETIVPIESRATDTISVNGWFVTLEIDLLPSDTIVVEEGPDNDDIVWNGNRSNLVSKEESEKIVNALKSATKLIVEVIDGQTIGIFNVPAIIGAK